MHFILFALKMLMGKNGFYFLSVHCNFELSSKTSLPISPARLRTLSHMNMRIHVNTLHSHKASVLCVSTTWSKCQFNAQFLYPIMRTECECVCEYLSKTANEPVHGVPDHIIALMLLQCRLWRRDHLTMEVMVDGWVQGDRHCWVVLSELILICCSPAGCEYETSEGREPENWSAHRQWSGHHWVKSWELRGSLVSCRWQLGG